MMPDLTLNQKLDTIMEKLVNSAEAVQAVYEMGNKVYNYNHESFAVKDIETVYNDIITDNSELTDKSAVGFTAILKTGESIYTYGNICYINGVLCEGLTSDGEAGYTFTGENGYEYVCVWYFENDGVLQINRTKTDIIEISLKVKQAMPNISADFFDFADLVTSNVNFTNSFTYFSTKKLKSTAGGTANDFIPTTLYEYESYCDTLPGHLYGFRNNTNIKKIVFPFLKTIQLSSSTSSNPGSFYNVNAEIEFKALETIAGGTYGSTAPFLNTNTVILPATVKTIGAKSFNNNRKIILNCNEAVTIDDAWCSVTPAELFSMCSDWAATINIAISAANWTQQQFEDLFLVEGKLRDLSELAGTDGYEISYDSEENPYCRAITIPSAKLASLSEEAKAAAKAKYWLVSGA